MTAGFIRGGAESDPEDTEHDRLASRPKVSSSRQSTSVTSYSFHPRGNSPINDTVADRIAAQYDDVYPPTEQDLLQSQHQQQAPKTRASTFATPSVPAKPREPPQKSKVTFSNPISLLDDDEFTTLLQSTSSAVRTRAVMVKSSSPLEPAVHDNVCGGFVEREIDPDADLDPAPMKRPYQHAVNSDEDYGDLQGETGVVGDGDIINDEYGGNQEMNDVERDEGMLFHL